MLELVSDNHRSSEVKRLAYSQIGLNSSENELILRDFPKDEFIRASSTYQMCVDHAEDLIETVRPSLYKYMEGPFTLSIYNHGETIKNSMLVFELQSIRDQNSSSEIITEDPMDFTSRSLAVIPFIDVFRPIITKEAERAARLIKSSKVTNMNDHIASNDRDTTLFITKYFMEALSQQSAEDNSNAIEIKTGKEAVSDMLATSLSAKSTFYDILWDQMTNFFEPSFRYIAEEHALGRVSLESPTHIL